MYTYCTYQNVSHSDLNSFLFIIAIIVVRIFQHTKLQQTNKNTYLIMLIFIIFHLTYTYNPIKFPSSNYYFQIKFHHECFLSADSQTSHVLSQWMKHEQSPAKYEMRKHLKRNEFLGLFQNNKMESICCRVINSYFK